MTRAGVVARCWSYPVKSRQGSQRDALMIDATGVRGDRAWDLVDAPSGNLASARRYSAPLMASATNERSRCRTAWWPTSGGRACDHG